MGVTMQFHAKMYEAYLRISGMQYSHLRQNDQCSCDNGQSISKCCPVLFTSNTLQIYVSLNFNQIHNIFYVKLMEHFLHFLFIQYSMFSLYMCPPNYLTHQVLPTYKPTYQQQNPYLRFLCGAVDLNTKTRKILNGGNQH